jgi:hypothetical protein
MNEGDTRKIDQNYRTYQAPDLPEQRPDPEATRQFARPEAATSQTPQKQPESEENPKTELWSRGRKRSGGGTQYNPFSSESSASAGEAAAEGEDPVVGWLVVIKGPGRGKAVRLGNHWNSIGRDADQRARIDFGDGHISRRNHARVNYEPRSRKFMITIGEGINPTYVRGENLLAPTELKTGDRIEIGETELMLVAVCGENFDWESDS